jgi:hypothetical protein
MRRCQELGAKELAIMDKDITKTENHCVARVEQIETNATLLIGIFVRE